MSDKKISDLTALTHPEDNDDTKLMIMGVASTGLLVSCTVAQLKALFVVLTTKYVATGSEGTTLTIPALAARKIVSIAREGAIMYEVTSSPDSVEFIWDSTTITLGLALNPGERLLIIHKA
jgi:hypothetical protein